MAIIEQHGRMRIRNSALTIKEKAESACARVKGMSGVLDVTLNERIGSMLVLFDDAKVKAEALLCNIAGALGIDVEALRESAQKLNRFIGSREGRRYVKRGMMGAGAVGLGMLAFSEKAHALAGAAFLGLAITHMYQNRRTLTK